MAYHLKGIEMAASDGFVMAVDRVFCKVDKALSGVMATSTVKHVIRLASAYAKNEANMVLHLPKNRGKGTVKDKVADYTCTIDFHNPNVKLISAFVGGTFPGYKQLIPDTWESRAVFDPAQMLSLVKSLHVDKDDQTSHIIRLHLEPENKQVLIRRIFDSTVSEMRMDAEVEGEGLAAININYLTQALEACQGTVTMKLTTPSSPMLFEDETHY